MEIPPLVASKLWQIKCGDYVFDAIDMPLSSSARDIVLKVSDWLSEREILLKGHHASRYGLIDTFV